MRRNRRNNNRRERMIMVFSSAFVLAALTMSGLYLRNKNARTQNDGYSIDFTALEEHVPSRTEEIAMHSVAEAESTAQETGEETEDPWGREKAPENRLTSGSAIAENPEDELDYMPLEVDSHTVEVAGWTEDETAEEVEPVPEEIGNVIASNVETAGLTRPVNGEILLPYSMDSSIYFATLDQYKYNPATIYQADEDTTVLACAEGIVVDIYEDPEIGRAVLLDLGNGYEAVYGQMKEIAVVENQHVYEGDTLGTVAQPTKYYSVEGGNLYFAVKKDGTAVDPQEMFH